MRKRQKLLSVDPTLFVMLDIVSDHGDPGMFPFFVNGKPRRRELGIGEGADRDGDHARHCVNDESHGGTASGAKAEGGAAPAIPD